MDKPTRLGWRIENTASKSEADVYVYDVIGDPWGDGTNAADFVREVNALAVDRINLHINSPGGYVNDALAMYNALIGHRAEVVGYVDGSADSAASFLLQAADKRVIAKNASMTIHEGHAFAMGPASAMRAAADELDAASENIASIYADRAGGTVAEWRDRMLANGGTRGTTYRGQQAVDVGLADEVGIHARNSKLLRIAALASRVKDQVSTTIAACLASCAYDGCTDAIEGWIESGELTIAEAATVTAAVTDAIASLEGNLGDLGNRVVSSAEDDEGGMGMMDAVPGRVAAGTSANTFAGLGDALKAARLAPPAPSLQQLLEEHQRAPLSAAIRS